MNSDAVGGSRVDDGAGLEDAKGFDLAGGGGINVEDDILEAAPEPADGGRGGGGRGHNILPSVIASSEGRLFPSDVFPLNDARCSPASLRWSNVRGARGLELALVLRTMPAITNASSTIVCVSWMPVRP